MSTRCEGTCLAPEGLDPACGFGGVTNPDGSTGCERAGCDYTEEDE